MPVAASGGGNNIRRTENVGDTRENANVQDNNKVAPMAAKPTGAPHGGVEPTGSASFLGDWTTTTTSSGPFGQCGHFQISNNRAAACRFLRGIFRRCECFNNNQFITFEGCFGTYFVELQL